jgi:hypothetical protein
MPEVRSWKCLTCHQEFKVGQWTCTDGTSNHIVEVKNYYSMDVPIDPGRPAEGSMMPIVRGTTTVCSIPPGKKVMMNDEVMFTGEGSVVFLNGFYATADPEKQYYLNKKPAYNHTEEEWKSVWLTKDEQLAEREMALKAREQRVENERNELLAKTKQQKGQLANA